MVSFAIPAKGLCQKCSQLHPSQSNRRRILLTIFPSKPTRRQEHAPYQHISTAPARRNARNERTSTATNTRTARGASTKHKHSPVRWRHARWCPAAFRTRGACRSGIKRQDATHRISDETATGITRANEPESRSTKNRGVPTNTQVTLRFVRRRLIASSGQFRGKHVYVRH